MNANDIEAHLLIGVEHIFKLILAQQAVIHKDTSQVLANRLVEQHGSHGAVDTTRKAQDNLVVAQLLFQTRYGIVDEGIRRPVAFAATNAKGEVSQHLWAFLGVEHLGMELHRVGLLAFNLVGSILHIVGRSDDASARRQLGDGVAMAHPHL